MSFTRRLLMSNSILYPPKIDLGEKSDLAVQRRITCHMHNDTWKNKAGVRLNFLHHDCSDILNKITVNSMPIPTNSTYWTTTGQPISAGTSTVWYGFTFWLKPGCTEVVDEMFKGCSQITRADLKLAITKVGTEAFMNTNLQQLLLYDDDYFVSEKPYSNLLEIGPGAFANSGLPLNYDNILRIPQYVRKIGSSAFANIYAHQIQFDGFPDEICSNAFSLVHWGANTSASVSSANKVIALEFGKNQIIRTEAFSQFTGYSTYEFSFDHTYVEPGAFKNLIPLTGGHVVFTGTILGHPGITSKSDIVTYTSPYQASDYNINMTNLSIV